MSEEKINGVELLDGTIITIEELFAEGGLMGAVQATEEYAAQENPGADAASTPTGRTQIKSLASRISSVRSGVDKCRLSYTKSLRDRVKATNDLGKVADERLTALRDAIRRPVDEFEAIDKRRQEAHAARIGEIERLSQIDPLTCTQEDIDAAQGNLRQLLKGHDWEEFEARAKAAAFDVQSAIADAQDGLNIREIAAESARKEAERQQEEVRAEQKRREEAVAKAAAEQAKAEAALAEAEREAAHARELAEAQAEKERAEERERLAKEQAVRDAEAAEVRAKGMAEQAAAAERQRIADEKRREEEAEAARIADVEHRRTVNREVVSALVKNVPISEGDAQNVVSAIIRGAIPHITLKY